MADVSKLRANINGVFETFNVKDKIARENVENLSKAISAAQIVDSASGAIASFSDGADDLPVRSLTVNLEPIQDLHGYDSPYPAGGGKNKFDKDNTTALDNVYIRGSDSTITAGGGNRGVIIPIKGGQTYTVSVQVKNATDIGVGSFADVPALGSVAGAKAASTAATAATVVTITTTAADNYLFVKYNNVNVTQTYTDAQVIAGLQIEEGSTVTAYAPYSNICPITGRDSVTVTRTGKNLWSAFEPYRTGSGLYTDDAGATLSPNVDTAVTVTKDGEDLYVTTTAGWKFAVFVQAGLATGTYTLSIDFDERAWSGSADGFDVAVLDGDYVITRKINHAASFVAKCRTTITLKNEESAIAVSVGGRSGTHGILRISAIQLEAGTIATAYEPYTAAQTVTVQLGDTVYHGSIDITTGKLIVDRMVFTVSAIATVASQSYIKADAIDGFVSNNNIYPQQPPGLQPSDLCSDCLKLTKNALWSAPGYPNHFAINNVQVHINIANDLLGVTDPASETTATAKEKLNTYLAEHPVTLTIPVKPFEVSITPAQLSTIKGHNIIQSDADSVDVTYIADPKLYIDKKIAEAISP